MTGRPGVGQGLRNWRRWEGPLAEKLRLAFRNNLLKARHQSPCCGNHGQPGC